MYREDLNCFIRDEATAKKYQKQKRVHELSGMI